MWAYVTHNYLKMEHWHLILSSGCNYVEMGKLRDYVIINLNFYFLCTTNNYLIYYVFFLEEMTEKYNWKGLCGFSSNLSLLKIPGLTVTYPGQDLGVPIPWVGLIFLKLMLSGNPQFFIGLGPKIIKNK